MALLGCPFCREMFSHDEATQCPVCGVPLQAVEKLPPSYEARVALAQELAKVAPEDRTLPLFYWKRGRGALVALALLGLAAFFVPWVTITLPVDMTLTGWGLAQIRGGWFFGSAIGWFVTLPLVLSRRTIYKMRGVRIITATFASLSVLEPAQLLLMPPRGGGRLPVEFAWEPGLYATLVLGVLGVLVASRFGGRLDDIDAAEFEDEKAPPELSPDQSTERTLH